MVFKGKLLSYAIDFICLGLPFLVIFFGLIKKRHQYIIYALVLFVILIFTNGLIYKYLKQDNIFHAGFSLIIVFTAGLVFAQFYLLVRYNRDLNKNQNLVNDALQINKNWAKEVIKVQEKERERISRDLHDDIGATLSALILHLSNKKAEEADKEQHRQHASFLINKVANDIRSISHDLLPRDFSQSDLFTLLESNIEALNQTGKIKFYFIPEGNENELDSNATAMMLFRITNELITNINKHSYATEASVQLGIWKDNVQIIVEDNGVGMNNIDKKGIGLLNISSRVNYLKGKLTIDSNYKGTTVVITIPLNASPYEK